MENKDKLAQNLISYRKQAGLSQLELANKLKYSNKNISKWENGETTPSIFVLQEIAIIYNVTVDDLLSGPKNVDKQVEQEFAKAKAKRKTIFNYGVLVFANAVLFLMACIAILVLSLCQITAFNKWLLLLYMLPLSCLSVFIFIRCLYKRLDPLTLSLFGWLLAVCVYVSLPMIKNIAMVFVVAGAYQVLVICISLIVNLKLLDKFAVNIKNLKQKIQKKNS